MHKIFKAGDKPGNIFSLYEDLQLNENSKRLLEASYKALYAYHKQGLTPKQALQALFPKPNLDLKWLPNANWVDATLILYLESKAEFAKGGTHGLFQ